MSENLRLKYLEEQLVLCNKLDLYAIFKSNIMKSVELFSRVDSTLMFQGIIEKVSLESVYIIGTDTYKCYSLDTFNKYYKFTIV